VTRKLKSRYGLTKDPFSKDVPVDELYVHPGAEAAVARLKATVQGRRSGVLTGDPGVGKTFVIRALEAKLLESRFRVTYVHNSTVNLRDFYRQLSQVLGLEPRATPSALFRAIRTHIEEIAAQKVHPVLVIDEAHLTQVQVLEHLHILLNFDRDSKPLLSLILVGLAHLRDRLQRNVLASLAARLPVRAHLEPLGTDLIGAYLRHRLENAGCVEEVFSEDAVLLIAECLEEAKLIDLLICATQLQLTVLLEVHEMDSLLKVRPHIGFPHAGYCLLGINNRDLTKMTTDLNHTLRLLEMVEDASILVSESGIRTHDDVQKLKQAGVRAVLVGEHLMREPDPGRALRQLLGKTA